jgi:hypothetical protein
MADRNPLFDLLAPTVTCSVTTPGMSWPLQLPLLKKMRGEEPAHHDIQAQTH